jgi:hypothetical protein
MSRTPTLYEIALAITTVSTYAGMREAVLDSPSPAAGTEPPEVRAKALVDRGYIVAGDPGGWGGTGSAVATILMESKGGADDVLVPLDYYENGLDDSLAATQELAKINPDALIEFANPSVALVYI